MIELCLLLVAQPIHLDWNETPNQHWTGAEWHANRLQDWNVTDGRVECTEVAERLPMRTMHFLPASINGFFEATVTTGAIQPSKETNPNSWSGFLIGVGSNDIDFRLSALTHHVPAEDGGLIAGIDSSGIVFLRDNSVPVGGTALWSINTKISPKSLPLITPWMSNGEGFNAEVPFPVRLQVAYKSMNDSHLDLDALVIKAINPSNNKTISAAMYGIDDLDLDGSIALVSHHGPPDSKVGFWFDDFTLQGDGVEFKEERLFGPVICTLYTMSNYTVKLTAQFPPVAAPARAILSFNGQQQSALIDTDSYTATFTIPNWDASQTTPYTVYLEGDDRGYEGTFRSEPSSDEPIKVAALTCHKTYTGGLKWNENGLWFPHADTVAAIEVRNPDLLYFSGDQIYEGDLTPARQVNEDAYLLDYLYKWNHWCWAFRELTRDRPCVTIPDDHDVYHGNLWGAGERDAQKVSGLTAQDSGGYKHNPRFVNAVHRTQTSHLPDPVDARPDAQGNSVYFTQLQYGGLDIAILGDRQFKESPAIAVPEGGVSNGWFKATGFDPKTEADKNVPLLGTRQETFLNSWSTEWTDDDWMKLLFSQSPFVCLQTLPEGTFGGHQAGLSIYPVGERAHNDVPAADADSNGWPQSARNRTLKMIKKANALHVCGDQHLGYVAQYGIDQHLDGTFVFCTPAIANTWPRRWMPKGLSITGNHEDGFGNLVTVSAVSNPHQYGQNPTALHDRAPGWGLLICDPETESVRIEAWPRSAKPNADDSEQYTGWPITVKNAGKSGSSLN